jgi:colicin import membrane protein
VANEYRITPAALGWKLPFNLALLLHVLLLSSAIILPKFLHRRPILPDIYTVDLINIVETLPAAPSAVSPPPPQTNREVTAPKPTVVKAKKTAPIAEPLNETISVQPVKAISIKPLKRKLKKKIPPDTTARDARRKQATEQKRQQQLLEERRQQLLQEAKRQKSIADAEAKLAANEAVNALKQSLRADAVVTSAKNSRRATGARGGGTASGLEAQYFSSIFSHLHQYWSLPDIKPWSPDTTAVVVVTLSKNGSIISHKFEKHSGDTVFDRFVSRTIEDANPLPAIPGALKKNTYTIGLRFRPGGIQ